MQKFFTDLHIHIGRSSNGSPIKITAARDLTLANILQECLGRKGINIIGIVDAASPKVQSDIEELITAGSLSEIEGGGLSYYGKATLLLGAEVETSEPAGGHAHFVSYFPTLGKVKAFTTVLQKYMKNVTLSSQKARLTAQGLFDIVDSLGGILIPAHAFTPHKSVFGCCAARLSQLLDKKAQNKIYAIELGLSSDTFLADRLTELSKVTFLSNSDAHSLPKIGREYNILALEEPSHQEVLAALKREKGRQVTANYGLEPRLGKYHRTYCLICDRIAEQVPPVLRCVHCGSDKIVKGVLDRIEEIADGKETHSPDHRPHYHYQVPLGFIPGVGSRTINKLLEHFGTEMAVLHKVSQEDLARVVGKKVASLICLARSGQAEVEVGGGGYYGKIRKEE